MPAALKRKDKGGKPYERPPEIEACIEKLDALDAGLGFRGSTGRQESTRSMCPQKPCLTFCGGPGSMEIRDSSRKPFVSC